MTQLIPQLQGLIAGLDRHSSTDQREVLHQCIKSLPPGVDQEVVWRQFMVWLLEQICLPCVQKGSEEYDAMQYIEQLYLYRCQDPDTWEESADKIQKLIKVIDVNSTWAEQIENKALLAVLAAAKAGQEWATDTVRGTAFRMVIAIWSTVEVVSSRLHAMGELIDDAAWKAAHQAMTKKLIELLENCR